jgi:pimeloyl-ACP methyl ester carboxylesterase
MHCEPSIERQYAACGNIAWEGAARCQWQWEVHARVLDGSAGAMTPSTHSEEHDVAERAEQLTSARALRGALAPDNITMPVPRPDEHVVLVRGVPVVPWIPLRAAEVVWSAWLDRLHALWKSWAPTPGVTPDDWEAWRSAHIHLLHAHHTRQGAGALALLLSSEQLAGVSVHLVGHSVGGASALAYLAQLRAGLVEPPRARLRAVITLDAPVVGIASIWTGTRQTLGASAPQALQRLGTWAAGHHIGLLTACNERDLWSHRAIADLPYVGMRLGPRFAALAQINGRIHGLLRRAPDLVEAIWTPEEGYLAPSGTRATPRLHSIASD